MWGLVGVQAEKNFTTLINTLTHQKEVYQKAEYKKRQGIDEDDVEKEKIEAQKKEDEAKKKAAAMAGIVSWIITATAAFFSPSLNYTCKKQA